MSAKTRAALVGCRMCLCEGVSMRRESWRARLSEWLTRRLGKWVWGLGFRVADEEAGEVGLGFRVWGLGFRVADEETGRAGVVRAGPLPPSCTPQLPRRCSSLAPHKGMLPTHTLPPSTRTHTSSAMHTHTHTHTHTPQVRMRINHAAKQPPLLHTPSLYLLLSTINHGCQAARACLRTANRVRPDPC